MSNAVREVLNLWMQVTTEILALAHKLGPGSRIFELLRGRGDEATQFIFLGASHGWLPFRFIGNTSWRWDAVRGDLPRWGRPVLRLKRCCQLEILSLLDPGRQKAR
jgi:hypothetical protein